MKAKKIIIPVIIVLGIAAVIIAVIALGNAASTVTYAQTCEIKQKSLENKVSVSGTVQSSNTKKVYSKLTYPVEKISVEVGDTVKKGDVLCTISTEDLQQQILQQQATVDNSGVNSDYNLSEAERQYNEALEKYQNGENNSIVSAKRAIEQAEKNLTEAKRQESFGTGTTLPSNMLSANDNLTRAKANYDNALDAYNKAVKELEPENYPVSVKTIYNSIEDYKKCKKIVDSGLFNPEISEAKTKYETLQREYEEKKMLSGDTLQERNDLQTLSDDIARAKNKYDTLVAKYDKKNIEDQLKALQEQLDSAIEKLESARDSAKIQLDSAKLAYDKAEADLGSMKEQTASSTETYSINIKNAEDALEQAKKDYERVVNQAESDLASLKKSAERQRTVSGLNDPQVIILQNLRDKLDYAVITAPCDGVVTAVNAEEGVAAAGALFVIEDLDSLKVTTTVGEYDIAYVSEGMNAVIRCDALGGAEYSGKVISVAPTSMAGTNGAVSYKVDTEVNDADGKLRVGMSTKVNIISEKKDNALTVTYDAVIDDGNGNDVVYAAEKDSDGNYRVKIIPVKIGIETDYEIEIISDSLKAGMYLLTDTAMLSDGDIVMINENKTEQVTE